MAKYTGSGGNKRFHSPATQIKRSLISLATFGYGNKAVDRDEEAVKIFEGFEDILRKTLPSSLGFTGIRIKMPDVILNTKTGQFAFEAVSGGVASIIDMAWQIHMYAQLHDEFVVAIDEPETHLHPELQQRLMPDLLAAFPKAQFIITTHSPFMVTSVPDSNVYVLRSNEARQVESSLLSITNKAGTADEILMEVLGVPSTIPRWAAAKVEKLIEEFTQAPLTEEGIKYPAKSSCTTYCFVSQKSPERTPANHNRSRGLRLRMYSQVAIADSSIGWGGRLPCVSRLA